MSRGKAARMTQREKTRFMKIVLIVDFVTLICIFIAAYVGYWFDKDMDTFLSLGCGAFSLELVITAFIKLFEKNDKKTEDSDATTLPTIKKING